MSWWGGAAEPEPVKEPEPVQEPVKEEEDQGMFWNAYNYTTGGIVYGATATKDGFVSVVSGSAEYVGDGYEWCEDTCVWAWDGTSSWVGNNLSCGAANTP